VSSDLHHSSINIRVQKSIIENYRLLSIKAKQIVSIITEIHQHVENTFAYRQSRLIASCYSYEQNDQKPIKFQKYINKCIYKISLSQYYVAIWLNLTNIF